MAREPERGRADVLGMRTRGFGAVVTGVLALAVAGGGTQWALAADSSALPSVHPNATLDGRPVACAAVDHTTGSSSAPAATGTVSLSVPRYTFIDERAAVTRVWTNTSGPPSRKDAFVVVLPGRWHPASAELVTATIALCH